MMLAWQELTAGRSEMQKAAGSRLVFGRIMEAYGRMLLQHGLFQADVHPGESAPGLASLQDSKSRGLPGWGHPHWVKSWSGALTSSLPFFRAVPALQMNWQGCRCVLLAWTPSHGH